MRDFYTFFEKFKNIIKKLWTLKETLKVHSNCLLITPNNSSKIPKLYYGGAIRGNRGGPAVKVQKLNRFFPEHNWDFNLTYLLSNSIYLSPSSVNIIKKKGLPIVLNQNGIFYPEWFEGDWEKENFRMSKIYHSADYVLWQSKFCKKASEKFLGKRIGKGEILYNAVDTSTFIPKTISYDNKFNFLVTGNIRKKNNYRILSVLYALKEIISEDKSVNLIIAGFIEDRKYIYSKIKNLNLENNIIFHDKYSQKEAPKIYQEADAYITMAYQDNCPTAVLEAMACGLPILYSASGGVPELVGKESGLGIKVEKNWQTTLVPEVLAISNGMKEIIDRQHNMSQASRIRAVEFFDIKDWIKRHKLVFEKLLDK